MLASSKRRPSPHGHQEALMAALLVLISLVPVAIETLKAIPI
jgi:hypothetical protein